MVTKNFHSHKIYTYEQLRRDPQKFDEVYEFIRMYGSHQIAYSILQPTMFYFIVDNLGVIAYSKRSRNARRRIVLGDPLARDKASILRLFLSVFPRASFVQVTKEGASLLSRLGYYSTPMGVETTVAIDDFDISRNTKKNLRNNIRNCKKSIKVFEHHECSSFDSSHLHTISQEWIRYQKGGKKELSFLARPFIDFNERDTRLFIALRDETIVGFAIFNPIYEDGTIIGYSSDLLRVSKDAPRGTGDYIQYLALKKFRRQAVQLLGLGLSPLHGLAHDDLKCHDKYTLRILHLIYNYGNFIYNFKGLARHKISYDGKEDVVYFCHKRTIPLIDIFTVFKISNAL